MKNLSLAKSYLDKAHKRLKILPLLLGEDDYSDVVREAQEIVELASQRDVASDWHRAAQVA